MAVTIRRAEPGDAAALGELHSFCYGELYAKLLPASVLTQLSPAMMAGLWEKFMSRGDAYKQWVAEMDGDIVAFVGVGPGREPEDTALKELYFIYVAPGARKSGIGSALLTAADPDYMWLWEDNSATRKFYKREKYTPELVHALRGRAPRRRHGSLFGTPLYEQRIIR